jgi:hypothetical protein
LTQVVCIRVLSFPPSLFSPAIYRQDPWALIPLDGNPTPQRSVAPPGPSLSTARRVDALPTPTGSSLPTVYFTVISPSRIGRSDLAISRDSRYCPRAINHRNPDGQRSTSGNRYSRRPSLYLSNPRVPKRRSHLNAPPVLHYIYGVPHCHVTSGFRPSRVRDSKVPAAGNPECRNPDAPDSCHLSALRSTVPIKSGDRTSRSLRAYDSCTRQFRFADMQRQKRVLSAPEV